MNKPSTLVPFKNKIQRITAAFIGSVMAVVIIILLFGEAVGAAKSIFANF
jgi:hypothetical protein